MNGDIVYTMSSDHLRLHGLYRRSDSRLLTTTTCGSVDAAVMLHGLGGNFYSSRLLNHFSDTLMRLGISVVLANTRGHDMINTSTWGGRSRSVGAALENVGDAIFDLAGWVDFLVDKGHSDILVFGHSLGAIKSLYSQAHQPHAKIRSIIGLSPTRLSYEKMIESPRGELFRETFQNCTNLVEQKRGDVPIHVPFPYPTWMTPQCYVEKYGPAETYNWMRFIKKVETPALLVFGQKELDGDPAFDGVRGELNTLRSGWNSLTIEEIEEADHFYTSKFEMVDDVVTRWLTD
ncbi:MAG: alpha/beta hydrolase [Mariniblastus sp.]